MCRASICSTNHNTAPVLSYFCLFHNPRFEKMGTTSSAPAAAVLVEPALLKDVSRVTKLLEGGENPSNVDAAGNHGLGLIFLVVLGCEQNETESETVLNIKSFVFQCQVLLLAVGL
jgi:hypothetical protein